MTTIKIEYTPGSYQSVILEKNKDFFIRFASGNFVKDWYRCIRYLMKNVAGEIFMSTSVDQFLMDFPGYKSAHLTAKNDRPILVYEGDKKGLEFFVPENITPSWEELKTICGDVA